MSCRFTHCLLFVAAVSLLSAEVQAQVQAADTFAGKYQGEKLSIELTPAKDGFAGQILMGDKKLPLKAKASDGRLAGEFTSGTDAYHFTAQLHGDDLTFETDGNTYTLHRLAQPVNPLAKIQPKDSGPPNPLAKGDPTPNSGSVAGYTTVNSTDFGKSLVTQKPKSTSVQAALEATLPDLAAIFGSRPTIVAAFEDSKDHHSGGASFAAKLNGKPVKGFISCKIVDQGAVVAVIYSQTDAPKGEWEKLAATVPAGGPPAPPRLPELKTLRFPDGTGSIGIADGWRTNAQTCAQTVIIQGPADQSVGIGNTFSVVTPDSTAVQIQRQLEMQARQLRAPPPKPLQLLVAPYTAPAEALTNLVPQLSRLSQQNGGPAFRLDEITSQQPLKNSLPNGKAALIRYKFTKATREGTSRQRGFAQIETTPIGVGSWMYYSVAVTAPEATYDRDEPVMLAMIASLKCNDAAIAQITRQNIDASNRRFEAMQAAHREQVAAYDAQNKAWERRSVEQSRSNADFDEVIRGYRTVEDTQTGEKTSVNLGNVDNVVDTLNQYNPGRYKQIPLRDETNPLPNGG